MDYPVIDSNTGISAEFAAFVTKQVNEFHSEADSMGDPTPETGLYTLTITYKPYIVGNSILGVKFTTNSFSGKTNKSNYIDTYVYDLGTGEKLGLDKIFDPSTDYMGLISERAKDYLSRNEKIAENMDEQLFASGTAPEIQNFSNFVITPDKKIIFFFNKNTIAPAEVAPSRWAYPFRSSWPRSIPVQ